MRRLRILLAGVLAAGMVAAWSGVVYADGPALGDFCDLADEADEALSGADFEDIDLSDPDSFREAYENAADAMNDARKRAPKKLESAFKTARKYYEQLAEVDFRDPEETTESFIPSGKVARAFQKITGYLMDECGVDATGEELEE